MITFRKDTNDKGKEKWFVFVPKDDESDDIAAGKVIQVQRQDGSIEEVALRNRTHTLFANGAGGLIGTFWTFSRIKVIRKPRPISPVQDFGGAIQVCGGTGGSRLMPTVHEIDSLSALRAMAWQHKFWSEHEDRIDYWREMSDRIELILAHVSGAEDEPAGCYRPLITQIQDDIERCRQMEKKDSTLSFNLNDHEVAIALLQDRLNKLGI